ncbi:PREDICTED: solute carrier family 35 member F5-like [Amphimedon queenslandica]|uniref:EamA domain-containing protein n=1 Tax=Amphimedon queenslandica TaxID=400682 RepID=A0A1X7UJB7_AMPQE|nr:PREDICTED: solute carrier family 35 member F5-like [Amphimedon queenslandica]|eukprot:XP_003387679.1 PREDICTED: solute carrier family 35 member F5-like [Amphimedon queenslandica]
MEPSDFSGAVLSHSSSSMEGRRGKKRVTSKRRRINKKEIFGVFLLIIVDLIWVGSAGLTRYLFHQQSYDKPFFTVYFKTILFITYLLPFLFWRPWQRLCCCSCCRFCDRRQEVEDSIASEGPVADDDDDDVFDDEQKDKFDDSGAVISSESSITSANVTDAQSLLGPSIYKPLRSSDNGHTGDNCVEDGRAEPSIPLSLSHSPSRSIQQEGMAPALNVTSSQSFIRRKKLVRFSQTVEVKHVPSISEYKVKNDKLILNVTQVITLSIPFGLLWFFANYFYGIALDHQSVAVVNTLSSISGVLVLILAAIPPKVGPKDKFTLTKLIIILTSVGGAILVGLAHSLDEDKKNSSAYGSLFAVGGAVLYAVYLVLLSKVVPNEESLEIPMFFGFVGVIVLIVITPLVAFWDFIKWEEFELPPNNMIWTLLLINGFIGTVLSELLWLWGCLLTSSLVGTLSLSLVTPLSITYSIITGEASLSPGFIIGSLLVVASFICVAVVNHWSGWDPVWNLIRFIIISFKSFHLSHTWNEVSSYESQSLLSGTETETLSQNERSINQ